MIEEIKSILKNQLDFIFISELSKKDYRNFIYEFFSMLNEYKNFGLKMIDIEEIVNDIFTYQSKYFDGNIVNEDKFGFITEELVCFCPSPFFWNIPLEEYMKKWEKLYFPYL
ncbi:hypothetical protein SDC9_01969 [bioreactor metagenome]|uniref:Uncharacterized protein n=1 Tax=bioreactor metagenome TaxID=1076179 RepID=A0A644SPC8_9ZZZZ